MHIQATNYNAIPNYKPIRTSHCSFQGKRLAQSKPGLYATLVCLVGLGASITLLEGTMQIASGGKKGYRGPIMNMIDYNIAEKNLRERGLSVPGKEKPGDWTEIQKNWQWGPPYDIATIRKWEAYKMAEEEQSNLI